MPSFDQVKEGDSLPPHKIPITATLIVSGAFATRDFQDVHHDKARAQELGSPDIFMNILTTNGLVSSYIMAWAGPKANLKSIDIKLGVPNFPGDTMTFEGKIVRRETTATEYLVDIDFRGHNRLGDHVTGHVLVNLP